MTHTDLERMEVAFNVGAVALGESPFMYFVLGMYVTDHDPAVVSEIMDVIRNEGDYDQDAVDHAINTLIATLKASTKLTVGGN